MRHILLRRLRIGLVSARFWVGYLLLVVLALLTLVVGADNHGRRQALFETESNADAEASHDHNRLRAYLSTFTTLHRPPASLSILAPGLGERYGSAARLRGRFAPPQIKNRSAFNAFLPGLENIDFVFVASSVLTLMAVFLSAETLARERESGTLQLILSNSVPRWRLIAGEYLGVAATLAPALLTVLVLGAGATIVGGSQQMGGELLARLGMLTAVLVLGVSAFIVLGLLASAWTRRPATALTTGFLIWIAVAALYPNASGWLIRHLKPLDRVVAVRAENIVTRTVGIPGGDDDDARLKQRENAFTARNREQAVWIERLWSMTPFSAILVNSRAAAGTDLEGWRRFRSQVSDLDRQLTEWQAAKLLRYPHRARGYAPSFGPLDLEGLPEGRFQAEPASAMWVRLVPNLGLLALWSLLGFLLLQFKFHGYDVRTD